jgi:hypothetical protein
VNKVNPFFEDLGARFVAAAERRGFPVPPPTLDAAVSSELLELARVAAHTQERRFAPLASYMAGVFAERLRAAGGPSDPAAVAALIREVREELEREAGTSQSIDADRSR